MKPTVQNLATTLITTLGIIVTAYFTVLPSLLKYEVEDASEKVSSDMAIENRKLMLEWKKLAEEREDSLWKVGLEYMQNIERRSNKLSAVVIRVDDDGKPYYDGTHKDVQSQPAYWKEDYKWWMYIDLRDGQLHPILFEDKITLQEMKYRAKIIYSPVFLENKIIEIYNELEGQ